MSDRSGWQVVYGDKNELVDTILRIVDGSDERCRPLTCSLQRRWRRIAKPDATPYSDTNVFSIRMG